jgi:hypothetical protein
MAANSEVLGNKGTKHSFDWNGKPVEMSYLNKKIRDAFSKQLFKRDRDLEKFVHEEDGTSDKEYREKLLALNDKFRLGGYELTSKFGREYIETEPGALFVASLMCGCSEDEMLKIFMAKGDEVLTLVKLVLDESVPDSKVKESGEQPDPKQEAPAA